MKMRHCKENGCRAIIPFSDSYCNAHKVLADNRLIIKEQQEKALREQSKGYQQSERHTRYVHSQRYQDIGASFYKTTQWRKLAQMIRVRDMYSCQICGSEASIVDHIVMRRADESLSLRAEDLWVLCSKHHNSKSHVEAKTSHKNLRQMTKSDWIKILKD